MPLNLENILWDETPQEKQKRLAVDISEKNLESDRLRNETIEKLSCSAAIAAEQAVKIVEETKEVMSGISKRIDTKRPGKWRLSVVRDSNMLIEYIDVEVV